ncbi:hypothetical protein [Kinneretia aquatilis]|uniref:hypothetical protein n=1 Tax=Kinneretia aquatilis TaxID=2070761 RepID=UPI00105748AA|nr:hypothetical protein [Paucibacter aquatile]
MRIGLNCAVFIVGTAALWMTQTVQAGHADVAVSSHGVAQGTGATSSESQSRSKATLTAASLGAQRDSDPSLNGSISGRTDQPPIAVLQAAAEAARRDQDPLINGAIGSPVTASIVRDAVAKR